MEMHEWEELMQETPSDGNHGWKISDLNGGGYWNDDGEGGRMHHGLRKPKQPLSVTDYETKDDAHLIDSDYLHDHGMVAHRGILHKHEWVDFDEVKKAIEQYLKISVKEINWIYGPGRPGSLRSVRRIWMDEQFLRLHEEGGNMTLLASVLGWHIEPSRGVSRKMTDALRRARAFRLTGGQDDLCCGQCGPAGCGDIQPFDQED